MRKTSLALLLIAAGCGATGEEMMEGARLEAQALLPTREGLPDTQVRNLAVLPGAAYLNGNTIVSYIATDSRINVMRKVNGVWFKTVLNEWVTDSGVGSRDVALGVYRNQLYMAWLGTDGQRTLNIRRSNDGANWPDQDKWQVSAQEGAHHYPMSVVVYGDRLNVFTQVENNTFKQYVFNQQGLEASARWWNADADRMTAAVLGNDLVVGWQVGTGALRTRKFVPGQGWSAIHTTNLFDCGTMVSADTSPPSLMFAGFNHPNNSGGAGDWQIFFSKSTDGFNFNYVSNVPDTSEAVVRALRANNNEVEWVWVGKNSTRNVNAGGIRF